MKTGILGGTFDPIHSGHLVVAEEATASLSLDEVVFIPAGQPWIKAGNHISAAEHRRVQPAQRVSGSPAPAPQSPSSAQQPTRAAHFMENAG